MIDLSYVSRPVAYTVRVYLRASERTIVSRRVDAWTKDLAASGWTGDATAAHGSLQRQALARVLILPLEALVGEAVELVIIDDGAPLPGTAFVGRFERLERPRIIL